MYGALRYSEMGGGLCCYHLLEQALAIILHCSCLLRGFKPCSKIRLYFLS